MQPELAAQTSPALLGAVQDFETRYQLVGEEVARITAAWSDLSASCQQILSQPIREEELSPTGQQTQSEEQIAARFAAVTAPLYRLCPMNTEYRPSGEPLLSDAFAQRAEDLATAAYNIGTQIDARRRRLAEKDREEKDRQQRAAAYRRKLEQEQELHDRRLAGEDV